MSTYIANLTDYIPQIRPFQPDLNFYANALQVKQGQFDQNFDQVSSMYSSIMNSPMLRDIDNKRRDEFFKAADSNMKKIAGMDLSKQENLTLAKNVFKPFYEDNNMMKDIAWTRQYQKELSRADSFKNCVDPKKCNGQYWETGIQALNYRAQEFRDSTDDKASGFSNPEFVPFHNVMEKAIAIAKEANLDVKHDVNTGNWIVTYKNGQIVEEPLRNLFIQNLGSDPDIKKMFVTQAYVNRKSYAEMNEFKHGSKDAAESYYLNSMVNTSMAGFVKEKEKVNTYANNLNDQKAYLEGKFNTQGLTDDESDAYAHIKGQMQKVPEVKSQVEYKQNLLSNVSGVGLDILRNRVDELVADGLMMNEFANAASTLSHRGEEVSMKENPFAMQAQRFAHEKEMQRLNMEGDLVRLAEKHKYDLNLAAYKQGLKDGNIPSNASSLVSKQSVPGTEYKVEGDQETLAFTESIREKSRVAGENQSKVVDALSSFYDHASLNENETIASQFKTEMDKKFGGNFTREALQNQISSGKMSWYEVFNMYNGAVSKLNSAKNTSWGSSALKENSKKMLEINLFRDTEDKMNREIIKWNNESVRDVQADHTSMFYKDADLLLKNGMPDNTEQGKKEFMRKFVERNKNSFYYKRPSDVMSDYMNFVGNVARKSGTNQDEVLKDMYYIEKEGDLFGREMHAKEIEQKYGRDFVDQAKKWDMARKVKVQQAGAGFISNVPFVHDDASKAYDVVKSRFYQVYSTKPVAILGNSEIGKQYGGVKANTVGTSIPSDPRHQNQDFRDFESVANDLVNNTNNLNIRIVFGTNPTGDGEPLSSKEAQNAFNLFKTINSARYMTYSKNDKKVPSLQFDYHTIANNSKGKQALTIRDINPLYLKELKGTKSQSGSYDDIINKIEENGGMTLMFDGDRANNGFSAATNPSIMDRRMRLGESYKVPNVADLTVKLDNNSYRVSGKIYPVNHPPISTNDIVFPQEMQPEAVNQFMIDMVHDIQSNNDEAKLIMAYDRWQKMKQENPQLTQKDAEGFFSNALNLGK